MPSTPLLALTAAGAGLVLIAVYAGMCALAPFLRCRACYGLGRVLGPTGRRGRKCRRCRGKGHRLRLGRRFWNWLSAEHHAGTHPAHPATRPTQERTTLR